MPADRRSRRNIIGLAAAAAALALGGCVTVVEPHPRRVYYNLHHGKSRRRGHGHHHGRHRH